MKSARPFLRFLALGGDKDYIVHAKGVQLRGGFISGKLDLQSCQDVRPLGLAWCRFEKAPFMRNAALVELILKGSHIPGLMADDIKVTGNVVLRDGFHASGEVRFLGATIGSQLACDGGRFDNTVAADSTDNAAFALNLQGARIGDICILCDAKINGSLGLQQAHVETLLDNPAGWPLLDHELSDNGAGGDSGVERLNGVIGLDGFTYNHIGAASPTDAKTRLQWLARQRPSHQGREFKPQPYEQLSNVLWEMGHRRDAARIDMAKQDRLLWVTVLRARWWTKPFVALLALLAYIFFGLCAGYGKSGWRLVCSLTFLWLSCAAAYSAAARHGVMAPADPLVYLKFAPDKACAQNWPRCVASRPALSPHTAFAPLLYSADIMLPIVDFGQERAWSPMIKGFTIKQISFSTFSPLGVDAPPANETTAPAIKTPAAGWTIPVHKNAIWALMWLQIIFGWSGSLLLVAMLSGLTGRKAS